MTRFSRRAIPIPKQIDQPTSVSIKQAEGVIGALADEVGTAMTTVEDRATTLETTSTDHETRVTTAEADIVTLEAADTALDGRVTTIETRIPTPLANFADDAAASAGGIAVGRFYRTASAVKVRVS